MKVNPLSCNEKELGRLRMKLKGIIKHYLACLVPRLDVLSPACRTQAIPDKSHLFIPLVPFKLDKQRKGGK